MRDLITGIVIGLAVGAIAVYAVTALTTPSGEEFCPANTQTTLDQKTVDSVAAKLNDLVHQQYPNVNVKISEYEPYGEVYLYKIKVEFYNEALGIRDSSDMYLTADGSILFNAINLKEQRINVSVDDDPSIGPEDAKVVIVEFSDYTCPYCAKFANEVEPKILENYGDKVKFVFRDFPVHGEIAYKGAEAADCAGEQGKYWEFHRILYEKQREWMSNTSMLYTYAEQLGLNVTAFKACLDSGKYKSEVDKDLQDGMSYGVTGTPTFFINGKKIVGYMPYEEFAKLIDKELNKQ